MIGFSHRSAGPEFELAASVRPLPLHFIQFGPKRHITRSRSGRVSPGDSCTGSVRLRVERCAPHNASVQPAGNLSLLTSPARCWWCAPSGRTPKDTVQTRTEVPFSQGLGRGAAGWLLCEAQVRTKGDIWDPHFLIGVRNSCFPSVRVGARSF